MYHHKSPILRFFSFLLQLKKFCMNKGCLCFLNVWPLTSYAVYLCNKYRHYFNWKARKIICKESPHPEAQAQAHHHCMTSEHPLCTKNISPDALETMFSCFMTCLFEHGRRLGAQNGGIKWNQCYKTYLISFFYLTQFLLSCRIKDRKFLATHWTMPFIVYEDLQRRRKGK